MDKISKSVEALQGKLHAWLSIKVKINITLILCQYKFVQNSNYLLVGETVMESPFLNSQHWL